MKLCPACKREFSDEIQFCRADGTRLIPQGALFAFQSRSAALAPAPEAPDADAPEPVAPPALSLWSAPNVPVEPETTVETAAIVEPETPIETETAVASTPIWRRLDGRFIAAGCALLLLLLVVWLDARRMTPQAAAPVAVLPAPSDLIVSAPPKEKPLPAAPSAEQPQAAPSVEQPQAAPDVTLKSESPRRPAPVSNPPRVARLPLLPLAPLPVAPMPEAPPAEFSARPAAPTPAPRPTAARPSPPRLALSQPRLALSSPQLAPSQPVWTAPAVPRVRLAPSLQSLRTPPASLPTPVAPPVPSGSSAPSAATGGSRTVAATASNRVPLLFGIGIGAYQGGPRHVVYVLDVSLSMPTRIRQAKEELQTALETLGQSETFNLVAFDKEAHPFQSSPASVTPNSIAQAEAWLDAQALGEGTNLEAALRFALGQPDVNTVVVLTDGVPTVGENNPDKLARLSRHLNTNRARIYTIGLVGKNPDGSDDSFQAAGLLQRLARESGGESRLTRLGDAVH